MDGKYGSYDANEMIRILNEIKRIMNNKLYAIFLDNASYHRAVEHFFIKNDVPVIYNAPYWPDLVGIERFWYKAKYLYKKKLTEY